MMMKEQKGFEPSTQKLIIRGKNTRDEQTMENIGVKDGDFIVLMLSKANNIINSIVLNDYGLFRELAKLSHSSPKRKKSRRNSRRIQG